MFFSRINWRLAHLSIHSKWKQATCFIRQCSLSSSFSFPFFFFCTVTRHDFICQIWLVSYSQLNQSLQLSLETLPSSIVGLNGWRVDNRKHTLLDFSVSLSKKQKSKRTRKTWRQWRRMVRRPGIICVALQCQFHRFEKVPHFVVGPVLSCLALQATNFFIWKYSFCVHSNMYAISVCFCNPPIYD